MQTDISSRRHFLGKMLALAGGSTVPFTMNLAAMGNAAAAGATDYKAIVCLFLAGGNDHFNPLLATDSGSWDEYRRLRATASTTSIALPAAGATGGVLPIAQRELVERDVNHPSVLFWSNGNEGGWNRELDRDFAFYDPQARPLIHPWEPFGGIDTKHYPRYPDLLREEQQEREEQMNKRAAGLHGRYSNRNTRRVTRAGCTQISPNHKSALPAPASPASASWSWTFYWARKNR